MKADAGVTGPMHTMPVVETAGVMVNQTLACASLVESLVGRSNVIQQPAGVANGLMVAQFCYEGEPGRLL